MVKEEKQRYVLFKIMNLFNIEFDQKDFLREIWRSIWRFFGLKGANKIGLWLLELDLIHSYGILRCTNSTKELLITALTFVREINHTKIILSPIKTSGTLKSIKKFIKKKN
ncbi:MAG: hypothetical protein EU544_01865 [Promethearchaeota archaeon]|nr:MAG: hypothetical protein EU544_01865 [Candidatus Lokiarchaeota archaeon]